MEAADEEGGLRRGFRSRRRDTSNGRKGRGGEIVLDRRSEPPETEVATEGWQTTLRKNESNRIRCVTRGYHENICTKFKPHYPSPASV